MKLGSKIRENTRIEEKIIFAQDNAPALKSEKIEGLAVWSSGASTLYIR